MTDPQPSVPWSSALVTGASSGIGEAMARILVRRGIGTIVLVARRETELERLASELKVGSEVEVEVLGADLTDAGALGRVGQRLASAERPVDLLVNNAGFGTAGPFHRLEPRGELDEIALNVTAPVSLCRAALPGMLERDRGTIINVSSLAGNQPSPGMATYSATKAFLTLFSESLFEEVRTTNVSVTAVLPGYTRTGFQDRVGETGFDSVPSVAWMTADAVAAAAIDDASKGRSLSIPGAVYKVANALESPVPRSARRWLIGRLSRFDPGS